MKQHNSFSIHFHGQIRLDFESVACAKNSLSISNCLSKIDIAVVCTFLFVLIFTQQKKSDTFNSQLYVSKWRSFYTHFVHTVIFQVPHFQGKITFHPSIASKCVSQSGWFYLEMHLILYKFTIFLGLNLIHHSKICVKLRTIKLSQNIKLEYNRTPVEGKL